MSHVVSSAGDISYNKLTIRLLPNLGYESNFWATHLMVLVCFVDHTDILDDSKLFVKKSNKTGTWFLWLFRIVRTKMALELVYKVGYHSGWLFSASILYMSNASGAEFFFLVLKCNLLRVISVQSKFFKYVLKVISAITITYIWDCQLQPGFPSHLVLLFYNDPEVNYCYIVGELVTIVGRKLLCTMIQIPHMLLLGGSF